MHLHKMVIRTKTMAEGTPILVDTLMLGKDETNKSYERLRGFLAVCDGCGCERYCFHNEERNGSTDE